MPTGPAQREERHPRLAADQADSPAWSMDKAKPQ